VPRRSDKVCVNNWYFFLTEYQEDVKEADKPKPEYGICRKGTAAELGNQRVDKLLCVKLDEKGNERHRRPFVYKTACNYLETMESAKEAAMGIAEARHRERLGESDGILW